MSTTTVSRECVNQVPRKATHVGTLGIAGFTIPCAVLDDGTRILSDQGFSRAIGRSRTRRRSNGEFIDNTPSFLAAENLKPFVSNGINCATTPILYAPPGVGRPGLGYPAELLPLVCQVYSSAYVARALLPSQVHVAEACIRLQAVLARVGIVALVDEATNFQETRDRTALRAIFDRYLRKEFAEWAKTFPDEFYRLMFKLRGWPWRPANPAKGPRIVAHLTDDIVYRRLRVNILDELRRRNPVLDGKREAKHHQLLTADVGHYELGQHMAVVIGFMRASADWPSFIRSLDRAAPRVGESVQLDFGDISGLDLAPPPSDN